MIYYNLFLVNFFLFYLTLKFNSNYFKIERHKFLIFLLYHLFLTGFYIFVFHDKPADYQKYVELKYVKPFSFGVSFTTTELIYTFIGFFRNILLFDKLNVIILFSLISFFGILIFVENLIKIGTDKKIAYLIYFIPGFHFWTCYPGKDSLILIALSCFFKFYIDRKFVISMFFIFIVLLIRPQIGLIFFLSIAITEFILSNWDKRIITLLFSFLFLYLILNLDFSSGYITNQLILSDNIFMQMLAKINSLSNKFWSTSAAYDPGNFLINIFNYIFFPIEFISKNNSLLINTTILVEITTAIYLSILILKQKKKFNFDKKIIYMLLTCSAIYLMILPQTFFNFGLNLRQKWMIIPFIIYLSFFLKNLFVKMKKI